MKRILIMLPMALLMPMPIFSIPALAQVSGPSVCKALKADWDDIEKDLASNLSRGITDNSAPRATLRKLEDVEQWAKADMVYAMMKDNKCPLPDSPPKAVTYFSAALDCESAKLRVRSSDVPECKRTNWKKTGE